MLPEGVAALRIVIALAGMGITFAVIGNTLSVGAPDATGFEGFMVCNNAYDETYRGDVHEASYKDGLWTFHDKAGRHVLNHQCSLYKWKGDADKAQPERLRY